MIKRALLSDADILARLAIKMWDSSSLNELKEDFESVIKSDEGVCFIKYDNEKPVGFAQCSLRHDYVEGTETSPVGYLEGIFVDEEHRRKGYAKELLSACEKWAIQKNCSEFASDCETFNTESLSFHLSMGFEEANRIICFRKSISS
ncbi:MAG: aminoglycoside 6'-N-acetyltransferase [Acutalibacteraceae bacterium]